MNNNSQTSLTASPSQSKVQVSTHTKERQSRQQRYKNKFSSRSHMIIPQEDFLWALDQPNSVKTLFMQCWMSDPYGSRPMQLNHNLKSSSFKSAKKIISEAGLFTFESKRSIRDGREAVCWMIVNLHGARRNDYWLGQQDSQKESKIEANNLASRVKSPTERVKDLTPKANHLTSISSQTQSQQEFQNPSETSQERLINSSKELMKTLPTENRVGDRDRDLALEGQVTSASPPKEKKATESKSALPTKPSEQLRQESEISRQSSKGALNKKSTNLSKRSFSEMNVRELMALDIEAMDMETLKKLPYLENRGFETTGKVSQEEKNRRIEDFELANKYNTRVRKAEERLINADKTTPEYQNAFKEFLARSRAFSKGKKKAKRLEREKRLKGSPRIAGRPAVEKYEYFSDW